MGKPELIDDEVLISNMYYLEFDKTIVARLMTVSGLDIAVEPVEVMQIGESGVRSITRVMGGKQKTGQLTLTRLAVASSGDDPLWTAFQEIQEKGPIVANRKEGAVNVYLSDVSTQLARYEFTGSWISKIATDQFDVTSAAAVKETITLEYDTLKRTQ
jgi:phage tail-like protein